MSEERIDATNEGRLDEVAERPIPGDPVLDGIGEEDNPIPRWFNWTFAATIVWAAFYIPYYLLSGWSAAGQWQAEVSAAEAAVAEVRQELPSENPFRGDPEAIAQGEQTFNTICAACHKPDGTGLVGPSLVDPYWKYGKDDASLYQTVAEGRPAGMPPWSSQLGRDEIWQVLAYMETLPKTDEPGVGAPADDPSAL